MSPASGSPVRLRMVEGKIIVLTTMLASILMFNQVSLEKTLN